MGKNRQEEIDMQFQKEAWGLTRQGQAASKYLLTNDKGMEVALSDFGALILSIRLDVRGSSRDVVLGYETVEQYYHNDPGFGAYVGRNGNRIANAGVTIEGVRYGLEPNDNGNNLHSGSNRAYYEFYDAVWGQEAGSLWVEFSRVSPHLEQGFPGDLRQQIRYTLDNTNQLTISYRMVCDRATVINPTNHCYFNLAGHGSGTVLAHTLTVAADHFLPTDDKLIPTGELRPVEGTPFDFRSPHVIGERIDDAYLPLQQAGGYDHNYCLNGSAPAVVLTSPGGDVTMEVTTDLPGMQVYAGNFLMGEEGKEGAVYSRRSGICFESQLYPNACNTPAFRSSIVPAGQVYESSTGYRFRF